MTDNTESIENSNIDPISGKDNSTEPKPSKLKLFAGYLTNNPISRWVYKHRYPLMIFFLPVAIMYLVYSFYGVHPWGDNSVLVLDLNGQYVSYYEMLRDAIWGDHSLIYSWSRNLSGETMGMFGYYLASPFMWIVVLLPRTMMMGALEIMQLAKIGCCALAFAHYLKKSRGASLYMQVVFSTSYAMMTYIVVELMNPMWIDGMIWLPLILLGIEILVDEGRMLLLTFSLSVMFISHFYIGYMLGFFSALYFIYYIFSRPDHVIAPHFVKSGFKFAFSAVISVLSAAAVLIPVYFSLKLGKLEFSEPDFSPVNQFNIFDLLTKLFANTYDTVRPEGLPMIACGTVVVLLIPLFFLNTKIKCKEKVSIAALSFCIFGSMYLSTVDIAWHGFQVPNWLPYRYSFTLSFLMLIMAYRALENMDGVSFKEVGLTAFGWVVMLAFLNQQEHPEFYLAETVWFSVLCIVVMTTLLFVFKKHGNTASRIVLAVFICLEIFENSMYTIWAIDCDVVYSKYSSYQDYFINGRRIVQELEEQDDSLYRMEKTFHRTVNDPIGMGFKGISHSSSTMNTPVLKMLKSLGFGMQGHYTKYTGATLLTDSLFGIKYLMYKPDDPQNAVDQKEINRLNIQSELKKPYEGYPIVMTTEDTGCEISVYENPYVLPIGYMASSKIKDTVLDSNDPINNQQKLLQAITGDKDTKVFKRNYSYVTDTVNVSTATTGDHIWYTTTVPEKDSYVEFTINIDSSEPMYAFFPTVYQRKCNMWVKADSWDITNYAFVDYFFTSEYYSILDLGSYEPGEKLHVRMTLANSEALFSDVLFYHLDTEALEAAVSDIRKGSWNITEHNDTWLKGSVNAEEDGVLFTTIPYEPGWTIKVDGEKVEPVKLIDSLIGIELTAGEHTITMKYLPDYLLLAIAVSVFGWSIVGIIFIIEFKNGRLLKAILKKTE